MTETKPIPLFAVVVPACNVGKYAKEMLDSIRSQTCGDFEALIMVEESTDGTLELCRAETAGDERFQVIPLPLSGSASNSRNYGIRNARARYVVFLDGDDWMAADSLERFREALERYDYPDLLSVSGNEYFEDSAGNRRFNRKWCNLSREFEGRIMTGCEALAAIGAAGRLPLVSVWLGVYRRQFLLEKELFQLPGVRHEDNEWMPKVWFFVQRLAVLDYPYVTYRKRPGSITTTPGPKSIHDMAVVLNALADFYFEHEFPEAVARTWASNWLSVFFWYFFLPMYDDKYPEKDRRAAFMAIFDRQGARFKELVRFAPRRKRLPTPLLLLAWKHGVEWPMKWFFRGVYYPLIEYREKLNRK